MKKTKVLILNLTPRLGMLHYSSQFCNELNNRKDINLKVVVASYYNEKLYNSSIERIKIRTNPTLLSFIFDTLNIPYHVYFLFSIIRFGPDVVHFMDNHPWYSAYAKLFKLFGYQIYTTQHDPVLHSGESKSLNGKIAAFTNKVLRNTSDKVMVHGDTLKEQMIDIYGIDQKKVISIPHGAYTFFSQFSEGGSVEKDTFLFFGRIADYKGLDILLSSLETVKESYPEFTLIIAGSGDITPYNRLLQKYKDNIKIYNFNIQAEDAYKYFDISEFVVLPYRDATGSGVIPVAYSFKKAVLVTDVGELASVVRSASGGYIVKPDNHNLLGEKILNMLKDKKNTKKMGVSGYKYSLEELSWKPIIDKIY